MFPSSIFHVLLFFPRFMKENILIRKIDKYSSLCLFSICKKLTAIFYIFGCQVLSFIIFPNKAYLRCTEDFLFLYFCTFVEVGTLSLNNIAVVPKTFVLLYPKSVG
uniref:Uncharacterized protein n=1 Tax=Cacopsylla melanoneura TaxID=428564 RepID=A0A8D9B0P5_9HEMI